MIPENIPDITNYKSLDIGRPDIIDDKSRQFWRKLHEYIKTCEYDIIPNNMFYYIDDRLSDDNYSYLGGGYVYMFWFKDETDLNSFKDYLKWECEAKG